MRRTRAHAAHAGWPWRAPIRRPRSRFAPVALADAAVGSPNSVQSFFCTSTIVRACSSSRWSRAHRACNAASRFCSALSIARRPRRRPSAARRLRRAHDATSSGASCTSPHGAAARRSPPHRRSRSASSSTESLYAALNCRRFATARTSGSGAVLGAAGTTCWRGADDIAFGFFLVDIRDLPFDLAARCATGGSDLRNLDRIQSCRAVTRNLCRTTAARDPSTEHIHAAAGSGLYRSYNHFSGSDEARSPYTLPANCNCSLPPHCWHGNEVRESAHQQYRDDVDAASTARKLDGAQRPVVAMAYRANTGGDRSTLLADFGRAIQP